ncbi:MAG TPA: SBBP repeat-containing protein, partial [Verrucomicrobiae bacterium]|nr:SBBP repeat-containing protein [Verrucomicrobiae bacterium]
MRPCGKKIPIAKSVLALFTGAGFLGLFAISVPAQPAMLPSGQALFFESNQGQVDSPAQYVARSQDSLFLISPDAAQVVLCRRTAPHTFTTREVRMQFAGAGGDAKISGVEALSGKINYLVGKDPARWHTDVPAYARVNVGSLYPGVSLDYYGNQRQLEYDLTVAPGADSGVIAMHFDGADELAVNPAGELVLSLGNNEILQRKPVIYQTINGLRTAVEGGYKILDARTVAFHVGSYNTNLPLVIDPILSYSTYFGETAADIAWKVAVDTNGFVYVAGQTLSAKLATTGTFQTNYAGGSFTGDAFVAKFSNSGSNLVYCTYLGGSQDDFASALAVDPAGNAFLTGFTDSPNFPTTNAIYPNILGHAFPQNFFNGNAFVTELDATGSRLVYSTYLGGGGTIFYANSGDAGTGIALDAAGNVYVTGYTTSTNFPVVNPLSYQLAGSTNLVLNRLAGYYNAFLSKLGPGGTNLLYSTYFGGTNYDIAEGISVDAAGNVYLAGFTDSTNFPTTAGAMQPVLGSFTNKYPVYNAFAAKFAQSSATNLALVYSTYLGGTNNDLAYGVASDAAGNTYVTGAATSPNFANTSSFHSELTNNTSGSILRTNAFLVKFGPAGSLIYSALFGGNSIDVASSVAVDSSGDAFICGGTTSTNYPAVNAAPYFAATNSGGSDVFVTRFNASGSAMRYSVYLGGAKNDYAYGLALDPQDNVYVVGQTFSSNFPTNNALDASLSGPSDAFLAKIVSTIAPPEIAVQPTNQSASAGSTVALTVNVTGTPPFSYQWQMQETNLSWMDLATVTNITGVTSNTLTISNAQATNSGNYQVIVTNYAGAVTSSVAVLTVTNVLPVITTQPESQTVGADSTVSFVVYGNNGTFPEMFQWFKDGTVLTDGTNASGSIISGSTNDPLVIYNVQTNDTGTYWLAITNPAGVVTSSNVVLTVVSFPTILVPPTNQTAGLGAVMDFSVAAAGSVPLHYRWLMNGTNATGGPVSGANTNETLSLANVQMGDSGRSFVVIVTNSLGAVTSSPSAVLTVLTAPRFAGVASIGGTNFAINGVGGTNGGIYSLLTTTNLAVPLTNWTSLGTNHFDSQGKFDFSYTLTNAMP